MHLSYFATSSQIDSLQENLNIVNVNIYMHS